MKKRDLLTIAAIGGLLVAAGCSKKDESAADSLGAAAMTDTTTLGTGTGNMAMPMDTGMAPVDTTVKDTTADTTIRR